MSPPQSPRSVCGRARTRTWVLLAPQCPVATSNDLPPSSGLVLASAPSLGPPHQQAKECSGTLVRDWAWAPEPDLLDPRAAWHLGVWLRGLPDIPVPLVSHSKAGIVPMAGHS